jgi:hypothetical protein
MPQSGSRKQPERAHQRDLGNRALKRLHLAKYWTRSRSFSFSFQQHSSFDPWTENPRVGGSILLPAAIETNHLKKPDVECPIRNQCAV